MTPLELIALYLNNGGLVNPEMMNHDAVRSLVILCRDEIERLRNALTKQNNEIEQTLGKALGYPYIYVATNADGRPMIVGDEYPGAEKTDDVCVGEHVAETLAMEAASRIKELTESLTEAADQIEEVTKERNLLRQVKVAVDASQKPNVTAFPTLEDIRNSYLAATLPEQLEALKVQVRNLVDENERLQLLQCVYCGEHIYSPGDWGNALDSVKAHDTVCEKAPWADLQRKYDAVERVRKSHEDQLVRIAAALGKDARQSADGTIAGLVENLKRSYDELQAVVAAGMPVTFAPANADDQLREVR